MSPRSLWCVVGVALCLSIACGGDESADTVSPPSSSVATTAAANRSPTDTPATRSIATATVETPTNEPTVQDEDLAEALLRLEDLPAGWSPTPPGDDDNDDDSGFCNQPPAVDPTAARASASADFQQSEFGPFFSQTLASYSSDDAKSIMKAIKDTLGSCSEWVQVADDGTSMTWHLLPLSFPKVGDETFAARLSTSDVPFFGAMQGDVVFWRRGNLIESVIYLTIGPAAGAPNPLADLVEKADERARKVWGLRP